MYLLRQEHDTGLQSKSYQGRWTFHPNELVLCGTPAATSPDVVPWDLCVASRAQ